MGSIKKAGRGYSRFTVKRMVDSSLVVRGKNLKIFIKEMIFQPNLEKEFLPLNLILHAVK